jgi:hypothetical protein
MAKKEIHVTLVEAEKVQKAGGATFRPLSRNTFRCNQLPRLGVLSQAQAETVRKQISALLHTPPVKPQALTPQRPGQRSVPAFPPYNTPSPRRLYC